MKIKATAIKGKDLKPGDLFSHLAQGWWDNIDNGSLGQKVYIRTNAPCPTGFDENTNTYRIEIEG